MLDSLKFGQSVIATLGKSLMGKLKLRGRFRVDHIRNGVVIDTQEFDNGIVDIGITTALDILFGVTAKISTWYIGLMNSGATEAAADTMSSHAGWTEFTNYTGNRLAWATATAAAKAITSSVATTFPILGTGTLYGIFVASNSTKGGTTGTLWSTAAFNSPISVVNGDQISVTYTVSGA